MSKIPTGEVFPSALAPPFRLPVGARSIAFLFLSVFALLLMGERSDAQLITYYWKDLSGNNGRWDWGSSQWYQSGSGYVGVPTSGGGAVLYFENTGNTDTYINGNGNFTGGWFKLNSIFISTGGTSKSYTISVDPLATGNGIELYGKIETVSGSVGTLSVNCDTRLGATSEINAVGAAITLNNLLMNGQTLNSYGGNSLNITGVISGTGTYNIKNQGITVTYSGSGANTFSGATTVENSSKLVLNKSANTAAIAGALTINSGALLRTDAAGQLNNQLVTVNGAFNMNGFGQSFALAGSGTVTNNATLTNNNTGDDTFSGIISSNGSLIKTGAGTLRLTGTSSTYTGATTVLGGLLAINGDGSIGTAPGAATANSIVISNATLGFNGSFTLNANRGMTLTHTSATLNVFDGNTVTYNGIIADSGTAALTKSGGGTLNLGGNNTYTGATTVGNGAVRATHANAFGTTAGGVTVSSGAAVELSGGIAVGAEALTLNGDGIGGGGSLRNISGNNSWAGGISNNSGARINVDGGSLTISGNITNANTTLYVGGVSNSTFSGTVTGANNSGNGTLYKDGAGTLTLSANNSGLTGLVRLLGGTISVTNMNSLGTGTLELGATTTQGVLLVNSNSSRSANILITDGTTNSAINVASGQVFTNAGNVSGGGNNTTKFGKAGAGTLLLAGTASTYGGQIQVGNGTLVIGSNGGLSTNTTTANRGVDLGLDIGDVSTANNVAVLASNGVTISNSFYIAPNTSSALRTIGISGAGTNTFNNEFYLGGSLTVDAGANATDMVTMSGNIVSNGSTSTGLIKTNAGILVLSGSGNNFIGGVTLGQGSLRIGGNNVLGTGTFIITNTGTVFASDGATARTNTNSITLGGDTQFGDATGTGALTVSNISVTKASVLTLSNNTTVAGVVSGSGNFTKSGTGTLTLNGTNTYSGTTTVNGGTLAINGANTGTGTTTVTGSSSVLRLGNTNALTNGVLLGSGSSTTIGLVDLAVGGNYVLNSYGSSANAGGNMAFTNSSGSSATITFTNATNAVTLSSGNNTGRFLTNLSTNLTLVFSGAIDIGSSANNDVAFGAIGNITINGAIFNTNTGSRAVTKNGTGTLTLTASNNYNGGTTITAGTLQVGNGGTTGSLGTNNVTNNATLAYNRSDAFSVSNVISGSGVLTKSGAGTLTLVGANTYSGGTLVSAGGLAGSTTTLQGVITNNSLVIFDQSTDGTYGSVISGTGALVKTNTGVVTLTNDNTYTGGTLIAGGALSIGNGGSTGSLLGVVTNNGGLVVNRTGALSITGAITGTGVLTNSGAGTLTLSGANTYNGGTLVSAGRIVGTTTSLQGNITNNSAVTFDQSTNGTYAGVLSGTGTMVKTNSGTVILTGDSTQSGGTLIAGGALSIGNGGATGSLLGVITNNGGLVVNRTGSLSMTGAITGTGALTNSGAGTLTLSGANTYNGGTLVSAGRIVGSTTSLQGNITNNSAVTFDQTTNGTYAGVLSGTGSMVKTNSGTVTLTGANTMNGGTLIASGTLSIGSGGTTGSLDGAITNNGTLAYNRSDAITNSSIISGTGNLTKDGAGSLVLSGANTYNGGTLVSAGTLAGDSTSLQGAITNNSLVLFTNAGIGTYSGIMSGSGGLTLNGVGSLTLSGNNTYAGNTTISAGTLVMNGVNTGAGVVIMNSSSSSILRLGATNALTNGVLSGASSAANSGTVDLAVGGNHSIAAYGNAANAGGYMNFTNSSGSVATLTFTAATNVVTLGNNGGRAITNSSTNLTLIFSGAVDIGSSTANDVTFTGPGNTVVNGAIFNTNTASRSLTKNGTGTLTLTASNTYNGGTTITTGTLQVGNGGTTGSLGTNNVTNNATLVYNRSDAFAVANIVSGSGNLTKVGAGTMTISGANTYSGGTTISNGAIALSGSGTLGATNGSVTVSGGTFDIGGLTRTNGAVSISTGQITNGTLQGSSFASTDGGTIGAVLAGSGALSKSGTGTLTLSGSNTYTGATTISNGTLVLSGSSGALAAATTVAISNGGTFDVGGRSQEIAGLTGAGAVTNSSGTLTVNNAANGTYSGVMSGAGGLTKTGAATMTLSGNNTYTGTTTVSLGVLSMGAASGTTIAGDILINGGTLNYGTSVNNQIASTANMTISLGQYLVGTRSDTLASLNMSGGSIVLGSGNLQFNGSSTISGGSLTNTNGSGSLIFVGGLTIGAATANYTGSQASANSLWVLSNSLTTTGSGVTVLSNNVTGGGGLPFLNLGGGSRTFNIVDGTAFDTAWGLRSGSMIKDGTGTLILRAAAVSTYTNTTLSNGVLLLGSDTALGTAASAGITLAGGTIASVDSSARTLLNNLTNRGNVTFGQASGGTGALTFSSTATNNMGGLTNILTTFVDTTIAGALGNGNITKAGNATLYLSNTNSSFGMLAINAGSVAFQTNAIVTGLSGTSTNTNALNLAGGTLTVNASSNSTFGQAIVGAGGLTKSGSGTLTLSASNSYSGATTVNLGRLALSGTNTSSAILVATNSGTTNTATLSGTGRAGDVVVASGGLIAPGNSPGNLTVGNFEMAGGGGYQWEISNVSGTPGVEWDLISITGSTTISATSGNKFTIYITGNSVTGWDANASTNWVIMDWSGGTGPASFDENAFILSTNSFGDTLAGLFSLSTNSTSLLLSYSSSATPTYSGTSGAWSTGFTPAIANNASAIFDGGGGTATNDIASATLSTIGSLTFATNASGSYTLTANSGSSGFDTNSALTVAGNIVNQSAYAQTVNLAVSVASSMTVDAASNDITLGGGIIGAGSIVKTGDSLLALNGNNSYTGSTTVSNGTVRLGSATALGATNGGTTVVSGATLDLNGQTVGTEALSIAGTGVGGNGALINSANSAASLAGAVTLTNATTINTTNAAGNITLSGAVGGTGSLTKTGTGTLILVASNSYAGGTTLNAGTLAVSNNNSLGSGTLTIGDGTRIAAVTTARTLSNAVVVNGNFSVGGFSATTTFAGGVDLGGATRTISYNNATAFNGVISNGGLVVNGDVASRTLTLGASNTFTGGVTVNGGTLRFTNNGALVSTSSVVLVGSGTADASLDITNIAASSFTIGSLASTNPGSSVTLGAKNLIVGGNNSSTTYEGDLTGTGGSLTKNGTGTLTLNKASTYTGGTILNTGGLAVGASSALGTGTLTINGGALGSVTSQRTLANNVVVGGNFSLGVGDQATTFNGTFDLGGATRTITLENSATLNGIVSNGGIVLNNGSSGSIRNFTLGTNNTFAGGITVNGGTLKLSGAGSIASSRVDLTGAGTNATLDITNVTTSTTIGSLAGTNPLSSVVLGSKTLDAGGDNTSSSFAGFISGAGSLVKSGSGTMTLTGTNSYSGGTLVSAGAIKGDTTSLQGTITNNSLVIFDQSTNGTYGSALSGTGALIKTNGGSLTLTGANTQSGGTMIGQGVLSVGAGGTSGSLAGVITNNATLVFNRSDNLTQSGAISGTGLVTKSGAGTVTLGGANTYSGGTLISAGALRGDTTSLQGAITNNSLVIFDQATGGTYGGALSGTGALIKTNAGVLTLSGANTYSGGTMVGAGTLAGSTTSLQGNITNNGTVAFTQSAGGTYAGTMSGSGALTKNGTGLLTIASNNSFSGGTTVSEGELHVNSAGGLGTGAVSITGTNPLSLAAVMYSNTVSPLTIGALTLNGNASVALQALSSMSSTGALTINSTNNFISLGGTAWTTGTNTLISGTSLTINGGASILLTGTTLNNGTLALGSSTNIGRSAFTFGSNSTSFYLVSAGAHFDVVWTGAENSLWNTNATNWQQTTDGLNPTGTNIAFATDDDVYFGNTATNGPITVDTGGVQAAEMYVTNSGGTVVFNGASLAAHNLYKSDNGNLTISNSLQLIGDDGGGPSSGVFSNTGSGNVTLAGAFTEGGLVHAGTGTITLSGANTYAGGTLVSSGVLSGNTTSLQGTITNNSLVIFDQSTNGTYSSALSGTGALTKSGAGTVTLGGANTYSGGTLVSGGALSGDTTSLQGAISNNATVVFAQTTNGTYAGAMSGTGSLTKSGSGTLVLGSSNSFSGNVNITGGAISISDANRLGATNNTLILDGGTLLSTASFDLGADRTLSIGLGGGTIFTDAGTQLTFNGIITNASTNTTVTKLGTGTLSVGSGSGVYTGNTVVGQGVLLLTTNTALSQSLVTVSNGAILTNNFTGSTIEIGDLQGSGTVDAGNNSVTVGSGGNSTTFSGAVNISGNNNFTSEGTGTLTLSGKVSDTMTGTTEVAAGTLQLSGSNDRLSTNAALSVSSGAVLDLNGVGQRVTGLSGAGTITNSPENNGSLTVNVASGANTFSGTMQGGMDFTKTGAGTMVLAGNNGFTGAVSVLGGTLSVGADNNFGNVANTVTLSNNSAAVSFSSSFSSSRDFTVATGTTGTLLAGSGVTTTLNGDLSKNGSVLVFGGGGSFVVGGVISGASAHSDLVVSNATVTLNSANTYSGPTYVHTGGVLNVGINDALPTDTSLYLGTNATSGTVNLQGYNQTVASLQTQGSAGTNNVVALGGGTLTVNGSSSTTYDGLISGSGSVVKSGTGTLALTAANTYSGSTTISNGTLRVSLIADGGVASSIGTGSSVTMAGSNPTNAVLDYTGGNVTTDRTFVMDNGGGTINMATSTTEMTLTGSASGSGKLIVGEGTLILNGATDAFAPGSIQVDSGATLQLAANNQIGNSTGLILNGGTFRVGTDTTGFSEQLGTLTLTANSTIDLGAWATGVRQLTFANSSAITWTGTLTITNWQGVALQSSSVAEILFGTGGLTSTQLGQVYWANQSISGGTLIGGSGELVPIPEPRVYAAAVALLAAVGWRERKRLLSLVRGKRSRK